MLIKILITLSIFVNYFIQGKTFLYSTKGKVYFVVDHTYDRVIRDYYRYIAESAQGAKLEEVKVGAETQYAAAQKISDADLGACNPIRLGLALNFSVFYYEVKNDHKKACELGEAAL
jgi:hypothetical protein